MDVYGKKASAPKGEYFRNNVWWWHPLWRYCCEVSEVANKVELAHSNDGDGLGKRDSLRLAKDLRAELETGRTARYEREHKAALDALPNEECYLCEGTGKRTDKPVNEGTPGAKLVPMGGILGDMTHWVIEVEPYECNGCSGTGEREPFAKNYPFSEENVREFAEFLEHCGGFEIC